MKRLSIIFLYVMLSLTAVAAGFSLMALTSSTAYAHNESDDEDSDSDSPRSVNETHPAKPDGEVRIDNLAGTVRVAGWDKNEVRVSGELGRQVQKLEVTEEAGGISIRVILPHNVNSRGCDECADLQIQVPKGSRLEVSTVSADVEASELTGPQQLGTVSGGVVLNSSSGHIDVRTVSGDVTVMGSAKNAQVAANSVSGTVRVANVDGSADVETVSGDVKLSGNKLSTVKMNATSGNLTFQGVLLKGGNYDFNNVSGDMILALGSAPNARIDVSSFTGDIDNSFGPKATRVSKYSPGMELHFTSGNPDASVNARTMSGDIHIQN
jgi:DUF4097 and DUF4098 domain-containing protein YvlB